MPRKRNYYDSPHTGNLFKDREEVREKEQKSFRRKLKNFFSFIIFLLIIFALIYCLFFSEFFVIKKISVSGTSRVEEIKKIENIVENFLEQKRWLVLENKNIFVFPEKSLVSVLKYNFDLEQVEIEKTLPGSIKIQIKKNRPAVVFKDNGNIFSVYADGVINSQVDSDFLIQNELPLVSRGTTTHVVIDEKVVSAKQIEIIEQVYALFNFYFKNIKINEFVVKNFESSEVELISSAGWRIIFSTELDAKESLEIAKKIIDEKIQGEAFEYIDLRVEGRGYWK